MDTILQISRQETMEQRFNKKHIDAKIRVAIAASETMQVRIAQGVALVQEYMQGQYYASKKKRIEQLMQMDIPVLVLEMFVGVAYCLKPELFTSVSAQLASRLKLNDRTEAITTVAELLAVLCRTDAFDISKESKMASLKLVSCIPLSDELVDFINNSQYLPPMLCTPLELTHNFSSGYLTHNDSLVLGAGNHHDGDLCLDVLNTLGNVALSLDTQFLCTVEESSNEITLESIIEAAAMKGQSLTPADAKERLRIALENWDSFKQQSYMFYSLMATQGNKFYLNHKVDKRGRIYASGYHITTQGTAFKKAMLEFAEPELVEGIM